MIRVLVNLSYDLVMASHFLKHYAALGIDEFVISTKVDDSAWMERLKEEAKGYPCRIVGPTPPRPVQGIGDNHDKLAELYCNPEDWIIPVDPDELNQYPHTLSYLIEQAKEENIHAYTGNFVDRISATGVLAETKRGASIWDQYPLQCNITDKLVKGWTSKVTLCRGDCKLSIGHHKLAEIKPTRDGIPVHHFKWRAGILESLEKRVLTYKKRGYEWVQESQRVLEYFKKNDGKINFTDFTISPAWKPAIEVFRI